MCRTFLESNKNYISNHPNLLLLCRSFTCRPKLPSLLDCVANNFLGFGKTVETRSRSYVWSSLLRWVNIFSFLSFSFDKLFLFLCCCFLAKKAPKNVVNKVDLYWRHLDINVLHTKTLFLRVLLWVKKNLIKPNCCIFS